MSKPNILYYFDGKEAIHVDLLSALMSDWLDAARGPGPRGRPARRDLLSYVRRKLEMSRDIRARAGFSRTRSCRARRAWRRQLEGELKPLFDAKCDLIRRWSAAGRIAPVDPGHLIFSIWAMTQHYADFEAQVGVLTPGAEDTRARAFAHVDSLFRSVLTPGDGART